MNLFKSDKKVQVVKQNETKNVFFSLEGISPLFIAPPNLILFIHAAKKFGGLLWKLAKYGSKIKDS